jgi:sugar O-acyltransferase (sialic acid O-acetyltransferase NeuD family)
MKEIVVAGNSSAAALLNEYIEYDLRYRIVAFAVDREYIREKSFLNRPVISLEEIATEYPSSSFSVLLGIGYSDLNRTRERLFSRLKEYGYTLETYIHPDAKIYSSNIGEGSIVLANAFIDVHACIGENTVVWSNSSICHHAKIGSNCWLATGSIVSADAEIDDNSFVGVGATVVNKVHVGKYNIIGAGAFIAKNTQDYGVYINRQTEKFRLSAEEYLRFAKL